MMMTAAAVGTTIDVGAVAAAAVGGPGPERRGGEAGLGRGRDPGIARGRRGTRPWCAAATMTAAAGTCMITGVGKS